MLSPTSRWGSRGEGRILQLEKGRGRLSRVALRVGCRRIRGADRRVLQAVCQAYQHALPAWHSCAGRSASWACLWLAQALASTPCRLCCLLPPQVCGIILGMLVLGFFADIIGRKWGSRWGGGRARRLPGAQLCRWGALAEANPPLPFSRLRDLICLLWKPGRHPEHSLRCSQRRLTSTIMLVGGALLTGSAGNDGQFLAMFLTSLFLFGTGMALWPFRVSV